MSDDAWWAPFYAHSAGKIVLSFVTDGEIESYLNRVELKRLGPKTLRSKEAIRKEIGKARKPGIAFASEEFAPGICGFAAPIVVGTRLRGALNVAIPIARFTADLEASLKMRLPRCAEDIARSAAQSQLSLKARPRSANKIQITKPSQLRDQPPHDVM